MKENQVHQDLASIRSLMERSSKFISLSGLSGVLAGVYALIGALLAYNRVFKGATFYPGQQMEIRLAQLTELIYMGLAVLCLSVITGLILTMRKAKRKAQPIWGNTSRDLLFNMAVPLISGGIFILIFINSGYFNLIAATCLIFYGLALIGAGNFTFKDVRYLGLCEIALGLSAAIYPGCGLLLWAIGFGVLHIVYGSIMYLKYDR